MERFKEMKNKRGFEGLRKGKFGAVIVRREMIFCLNFERKEDAKCQKNCIEDTI